MKKFMSQIKKAAVVLTVGAVLGAGAAFALSPLGATAAVAGWVIAGGYGVMLAGGEMGL